MRNFLIWVLFLSVLICSCARAGDKKSIQFTDGTIKTVYGLYQDGETVNYYLSEKDASEGNGKVTIPLNTVKKIVDLEDE